MAVPSKEPDNRSKTGLSSEIKAEISDEIGRIYADERRAASEARWRGGLAYLIVIALIAISLFGMWRRMPPGDLVQYLSPLIGLAGLAVGYYFGSGQRPRR